MPAARLAARASSPPLPALPIAPIVPEIPSIGAVFYPCVVAQRTTNDPVVYSRDLGRIITVAYPLGQFGARIVPRGIFHWMERRGFVLECFCALVSSQPTPARFIDEFGSGHTVVRCHHVDNQCGFYLDLTKIHMMTMLESAYERIPTLSHGNPDIPAVLSRWHRLVANNSTLLKHPAPFVDGYFSIHTSMYPGIKQLRSSGLASPRRTPYHPYHHRRASLSPNKRVTLLRSTANQSPHRRVSVGALPMAMVAGPSRLMRKIPEGFSEHETETLDALRLGFGISRDNIETLFEECDHCGQSFMRSALRVHIKQVEEAKNTTTSDVEEQATTSNVNVV